MRHKAPAHHAEGGGGRAEVLVRLVVVVSGGGRRGIDGEFPAGPTRVGAVRSVEAGAVPVVGG